LELIGRRVADQENLKTFVDNRTTDETDIYRKIAITFQTEANVQLRLWEGAKRTHVESASLFGAPLECL
jgi:hypothetical protein